MCRKRLRQGWSLPQRQAEEKFTGFRVEREETSTFPGDWVASKGKTVKIYTMQPVSQNPKESGPAVRLNYSLALFQKGLKEAAGANPAPEGIVAIFDSADGGIAGATLALIQRMVKGEVFAGSALGAELFGSGGGVSRDWASVTLAQRAFTTEDPEETHSLKKEDVESRTCRCASGKRGRPPPSCGGQAEGGPYEKKCTEPTCEDCRKRPSAAKAASNLRELRHG
jgi:hypothetical protein